MTISPLQRRNQQRVERLRGWIINILYVARPEPLELAVLSDSLDGYNQGCSRRTLAMELEFLRSLKLLAVFPLGSIDELTNAEQAKLIQRYSRSDNDQEMHMVLCASLRAPGINFQEGLQQEVAGVERVR